MQMTGKSIGNGHANTRPLKLALIGVGGFGGFHLKYIEGLERSHRVELVAVADPATTSSRPALEARGVRWYQDYRQMLEKERDLDAVQIATPIPLHFEMAKECIGHGVFVNLEKPPVVLIQQLDELIECDSAGHVSVGFQHISSVQVQQLKEWIVQGRLGELREIRLSACWPRCASYYQRNQWAGKMTHEGRPVYDGPATNAMAHLIENAMFLAGSTQEGFDEPEGVQAEIYRVRPIESYDLIAIRAQFASGVKMVASLTHATEQEQPFWIEARGSRDWARISNNGERLESSDGIHLFPPETEMDPFVRMHEDFVNFATGSRPRARVRLADTRGYLLTTNGALISSGGIHDVAPKYFRTYSAREGEGYHVHGLSGLMERSTAERALFSEMNAPWAHAARPVAVRDINSLNLSGFLIA